MFESVIENNLTSEADEPLSVTVYGPVESRTDVKKAAGAFKGGKWRNLLKMGFEALLDYFSDDPLSFGEYLTVTSNYVDAKAEEISRKQGLRFVGGECLFTVNREYEWVDITVKMYFKNAANKWIMQETYGKTSFMCFTAETLDGEITDIMNAGGKKYPITPAKR